MRLRISRVLVLVLRFAYLPFTIYHLFTNGLPAEGLSVSLLSKLT